MNLTFKKIGFLLFLCIAVSNLALADPSKSTWRLQLEETKGTKLYQAGKYQQAYQLLAPLAKVGLKQAQYLVAFMTMKGQGTQADPISGIAWLGVAKESEIPEWTTQYQQAVAMLTAQQKSQLQSIEQEFIRLYGMKKQRVICEVRQHSTRARNKQVILCFKDKLNNIESFDI